MNPKQQQTLQVAEIWFLLKVLWTVHETKRVQQEFILCQTIEHQQKSLGLHNSKTRT